MRLVVIEAVRQGYGKDPYQTSCSKSFVYLGLYEQSAHNAIDLIDVQSLVVKCYVHEAFDVFGLLRKSEAHTVVLFDASLTGVVDAELEDIRALRLPFQSWQRADDSRGGDERLSFSGVGRAN